MQIWDWAHLSLINMNFLYSFEDYIHMVYHPKEKLIQNSYNFFLILWLASSYSLSIFLFFYSLLQQFVGILFIRNSSSVVSVANIFPNVHLF